MGERCRVRERRKEEEAKESAEVEMPNAATREVATLSDERDFTATAYTQPQTAGGRARPTAEPTEVAERTGQ